MLTDLAFYKPAYMLSGNEEGWSEFQLFYASSVDNCTLAPEKLTDFKCQEKWLVKISSNEDSQINLNKNS
jgi:hypothetical protein